MADQQQVVDRRALLGLMAGLMGLAFCVGAVVLDMPLLAAAGGLCALLAGIAPVQLLRELQDAERRASAASALARLLDVPGPARAEPVSLIDTESQLPNGRYFELAVDGRVAAARRHLWPVTIVVLEISLNPSLPDREAQEKAIRAFAELMRITLRESDVACRLGPRAFGLVLEDTGEEGGVWTVERLQIGLAQDITKVRRITAGVAAYPTHGLQADEVLSRAQAALTRACAAEAGRGLGQVEVAQADA
jgi:diguanylate cyclase (GGDEF)-like protein